MTNILGIPKHKYYLKTVLMRLAITYIRKFSLNIHILFLNKKYETYIYKNINYKKSFCNFFYLIRVFVLKYNIH